MVYTHLVQRVTGSVTTMTYLVDSVIPGGNFRSLAVSLALFKHTHQFVVLDRTGARDIGLQHVCSHTVKGPRFLTNRI